MYERRLSVEIAWLRDMLDGLTLQKLASLIFHGVLTMFAAAVKAEMLQPATKKLKF